MTQCQYNGKLRQPFTQRLKKRRKVCLYTDHVWSKSPENSALQFVSFDCMATIGFHYIGSGWNSFPSVKFQKFQRIFCGQCHQSPHRHRREYKMGKILILRELSFYLINFKGKVSSKLATNEDFFQFSVKEHLVSD